MDALAATHARTSIRQSRGTPVSRDTIVQVLEAGRQVPSGKNRQPWHSIAAQGAKKTEPVEVMWGALLRGVT